MIKSIKNYTYKSFSDYSTPDEFFKKKNILFGYNGRGKSSLSRGIFEEYSKKGDLEGSVRFFNREYIKERLLLEESNSAIKGVKVSFSKNDADIAIEIKALEEKIVNVEKQKQKNKQDRTNIRKKIDAIHDSKKGNANINKKPLKSKIEDVIEQYNTDLKKALEINKSLDYIKTFNADIKALEKDEEIVANIQLPNLKIDELSLDDIGFIFTTLKKEYIIANEIPTSEVISWLDDGILLHEDSDTECKFCGSSFNLGHIKELVKKYKEDSKQKDIFKLEEIKRILDSNVDIINKARDIKGNLSVIGFSEEQIAELFNFNYGKYISNLIEKIEEKILDMEKSIELDDYIFKFEKEVRDKCKEIEKIYSQKTKEIATSISNIEKLAKGAIAIAIEESDIPREIGEIQKNERQVEKIEEENQKLLGEIRDLKASMSEYSDFMIFLNEILDSLGIHIKLSLIDNAYYLKHTLKNCDLTIDNISEGEKNLLALLYFYFELYSDREQGKIKPDIGLIIIDDPISSLDDSNKFYVLEILKKILSEKTPQIFLLTHSWNDFCQITYGIKTDNTDYGIFEIYKNSSNNFHSEIRVCQGNIAPYKKLFQEIFLLKDKNTDELEQCDTYHSANSMRRIFEEFLNFKKPNLLPQKSNQATIERLYYNATGKQLGNSKKCDLGELLAFINVLSHRPIRAEEVVKNSKTLMRIIEDMDKVHYNEMKNNNHHHA